MIYLVISFVSVEIVPSLQKLFYTRVLVTVLERSPPLCLFEEEKKIDVGRETSTS